MAFFLDTLLHANSLSHHVEVTAEDEELSPTLENFIVLTWLNLMHPELPKLVKQRYLTESRTVASTTPEISQAHHSPLDEIHTAEDVKIMRTAASGYRKLSGGRTPFNVSTRPYRPARSCPLCKRAGHPHNAHFLSEWSFFLEQDCKYIAKARQIADIFDSRHPHPPRPDPMRMNQTATLMTLDLPPSTYVFRIQNRQFPYLDMLCTPPSAHNHIYVAN